MPSVAERIAAPQSAAVTPTEPAAAAPGPGFIAGLLARSKRQAGPTEAPGAQQGGDDVLSPQKAIELALDETQEIEGGFVDNPADRGGATNRGVTLKTLQRHKPGATVDQLKKLTSAEAREIFRKEYVEEPGFEKLPAYLIPHAVGISIHAGPVKAIKLMQEAAGVTPDGKLGPATLAAVKKLNADKFRDSIEDFYADIVKANPSQAQFLKGWLKRARRLHKVTGEVVTEKPRGRQVAGANEVGDFVEVYEGSDGKMYTMSLEGELTEYRG